jgi:DNA polymerase-4
MSLDKHKLKGRTITLKIKYSDFKQVTRSLSLTSRTAEATVIIQTAQQLLAVTDIENSRIRLLGITVSNFYDAEVKAKPQNAQLSLFNFL